MEREGKGYIKNPLTHFGEAVTDFRKRNGVSNKELARQGFITFKQSALLSDMSRNQDCVMRQVQEKSEELYQLINSFAHIDARTVSKENGDNYPNCYNSYQSTYQEAVFEDIGHCCEWNPIESENQDENYSSCDDESN